MILGSQRLGHEMQTGVMTNIPIRVALRTLDDVDSRAVLGSDEAKWLANAKRAAEEIRDIVKRMNRITSGERLL